MTTISLAKTAALRFRLVARPTESLLRHRDLSFSDMEPVNSASSVIGGIIASAALSLAVKELITRSYNSTFSEGSPKFPYQQYITPFAMELCVNTAGFDHQSLVVHIENKDLMISGETEDILGGEMQIREKLVVKGPVNFDPETVAAHVNDGQMKIVFPFPIDRKAKKKAGKYLVRFY